MPDDQEWWVKWAPPLMMFGGVMTLVAGLLGIWLWGLRATLVKESLVEARRLLQDARLILDLAARTQELAFRQRDDVKKVADRVVHDVKDSLKDTVAAIGGSSHGELRIPPLPPLPPPLGK